LKPETLDYKWRISTAGGETMGASVILESLKINQVHVKNVEAMVLRSDLEQSLLGMSFLSQLYAYEFRGERLILRQ
ncbi:MAG: TIGR02281 family clan AA aspartic protease, partial [Pseudomonadota bacterium]